MSSGQTPKSGDEPAPSGEHLHAHEAFDPEPIRELPPDEPRTPLWLPALGLAFFVAFGAYLSLGDEEAETAADGTTVGSASAAAVAAPTPPGAQARPARPTPRAAPTATASGARADIEAIRQRLFNLRSRRNAGAAGSGRPQAQPVQPGGQRQPAGGH